MRDAVKADADAIAAVQASATRALRLTYRPSVETLAKAPPLRRWERMLVAVRGARVIGSVRSRPRDGYLHLVALGVLARQRRKGVARALVAGAEAKARRAGLRGLSLYTVRETGNEEVFRKLGFRTVRAEVSRLFESDRHPVLTELFMTLRFR